MNEEPFEVREPLVMISVARSYGEGVDPYRAVQFAWAVGEESRACHLVLARVGSTIVGAYRPYEWLPGTREHFPSREPEPDRWGFYGREAEPEVWDYYVGREVPERFRRSRGNPIKYCQPGD